MPREKRPIHPLMHVPVPWVFVLAYFAGVGLQRLLPVAIVRADSPLKVVFLCAGLGLVAAGFVIGGWCLWMFRKAGTTTVPFKVSSRLITTGPYRFTRNPMYVAVTSVYVGETLIFQHVFSFALLFFVLAYLNWIVIPVEEKQLAATFGEDYDAYRARVRRWL